jgi:hypothetical protein
MLYFDYKIRKAENKMFNIIAGLIILLLIFGGSVLLAVFIFSIKEFYTAHKNSDVRMSFEQFRRIYNLSPNKWFYYNDCTMGRKEYIKENGNGIISKEVFISMKTFLTSCVSSFGNGR